jgi:acetyl-CoA carboxylase biotin carboxyl carrier protein
MTTKEIKDLIKILDESNLAEFQMKNKDVELKIRSNKFFEGKGTSIVTQPMQMAPPMQVQQAPAASQAPAPQSNESAAKPQAEDTSNYIEIKSPMVGTFYRSSGPDKPVFASVGDSIQEGTVVCIIEAMKLFNEIESEITGKIVKVLVEDATPVEYDQVLFLVEP